MDEWTAVYRTVVFIIALIVGGGLVAWIGQLRLRNAILSREIDLFKREVVRLEEQLRIERTSPDSARLINQLTNQVDRLEAMLVRRNADIKEKDAYIEKIETAWDRMEQRLKDKGFFGFERPLSPQLQYSQLADQMNTHLSLDEVKTLCLAIDVDYENLEPGGKHTKIISLVQKLRQRGQIHVLLSILNQRRPETPWIEL